MKAFVTGSALLSWSMLCGGVAQAQQGVLCPPQPAAEPAASARADSTSARPDIVIRASVHADELRFSSQPRVDVRLTGCSVLDTVRVLERRNLPRPVQPGVTYRDIHVAVEILGHLNARCLLQGLLAADSTAVAGALGRLCAAGDTATAATPGEPR